MKITIGQLKQLIKEQLEEDWRDFASGGERVESHLSKYDRDRYDKYNEREREERAYRDQQQAAWRRENTPNNADREQAADRTRAAEQQQAAQAKQAAGAAATKEATAKANKLLKLLNSEEISNSLIKTELMHINNNLEFG